MNVFPYSCFHFFYTYPDLEITEMKFQTFHYCETLSNNIKGKKGLIHFTASMPSNSETFFPTTKAPVRGEESVTNIERTDCEALNVMSLFVSHPQPSLLLSLSILAWHFHNKHFGLSHSAVWQADVCQGTIFHSIQAALIKINPPDTFSECVLILDVLNPNPCLGCIICWTNQIHTYFNK